VSDEITAEEKQAILDAVVASEAAFDANPESAEARLALHEARVNAGWHEFRAETNSPTPPGHYVPWIARKRVSCVETWGEHEKKAYSSAIPLKFWLEPSETSERKIHAATICSDGEWRRTVELEVDVVAIEGLIHLRSLAERLELGLMVLPPDASGLPVLQVKDDRDY